MAHFVPNLIQLGLDNLKHDPNYVQDDEEDEDEMPDSRESDLEEDNEYDAEDYSDDDDISWKVRRASAKLLTAIIDSYPDTLPEIYSEVAPTLISRFNEREESVRVEILTSFRELVRVTGLQGEEILLSRDVPVGVGKRRRESSQSGDRPPPPKALGSQLLSLVPRMSKALTKQLAGSSVPTKLAGFALAREVVEVLNGGLSEVLPSYIRPIDSAMEMQGQSKVASVGAGGAANESNLKIETLKFIKSIFKTHSARTIGTQSAADLAKVVNDAIASEKFYKVVAEAFDTVVPIISALGVLGDRNSLNSLAQSIRDKVAAADIDQEVREKSIIALGTVLKTVGADAGFNLLVDRLKIESVRLVTVKVIADVVEQSSAVGGPWVDTMVGELSAYLRRTNRELKSASLRAIFAILKAFPGDVSQDKFTTLVDNLCAVLTSDDTQLYPSALNVVPLVVLNPAVNLDLANSPLPSTIVGLFDRQVVQTQGIAWTPYGDCIVALSKKGLGGPIYDGLVKDRDWDSGSLAANAKGIATIIISTPDAPQWSVWRNVPENATLETRLLRLMVLGEGGKIAAENQQGTPLTDDLLNLLMVEMKDPDEKIRNAAAFAVGGLVAGSVQKHFPILLEYLHRTTESVERSLVLHAIKEVNPTLSGPDIRSSLSIRRIQGPTYWINLISGMSYSEKKILIHPQIEIWRANVLDSIS